MKTRSYLVVLLLLLLAAGAFAAARSTTVYGQGDWPCDQVVVDRAGVLGADIARVEDAADRLVRLGATVRVFTVPTTGIENLDLYVDSLEKACPSWQAADGERKNNLIVLGISVDEELTGLYYGAVWVDLLDPRQIGIQTEVINPYFRGGNFAGGLAAGLDEVAGLIEAQRHPPTAAPAAGGGTASAGAGAVAAGVIGGLAVLGGATAGGVALYRARAARRRAQQRARELKMKLADRILRLPEEITFAEVELINLEARVAKSEYRGLPQKLAEARRLIDQVNADAQNVQLAGSDPDRAGLTREEYAGFAASFEELLNRLDQAGRAVSEVRAEIQALHDLPDQLPAAVDQSQAAVEQARARVAEDTSASPNRQAESLLQQAQEKVDGARDAGKKKRPRQAMTLLGEVQPLLAQAAAVTGLLPSLRQRIAQVDQVVDEGASVFEQLAARFADASWQAVRGNGTEADNRLVWAEEALEEAAAGLASDDAEQWAAVPERVQQAQAWLDESAALVQSIRDQHQHLEQSRQEAPQEARQAGEDIAKAREYILRYDRNIREQLEHDLDDAERDWTQVSGELAGERPDYPGIVQRVKGIRKVTDGILAAARSEHEAIELLVQRYPGEARAAQRALSSADSYLRNHAGDIGAAARQQAQQAEQSLRAAQRHRSQADELEDIARRKALEEAVRLAQQAGGQAADAAARARQDVRRADQARRPPITLPSGGSGSWGVSGGWGTPRPIPGPRPASTPRPTPGPRPASTPRPAPRPRPSSGGHSGGGSSTGWGRPSSGKSSGGSSTSWGGTSRRRGGGSTGW